MCVCYPLQDSEDDDDDAEDDSDREAEKAKVRENIAKKLKKDKTDEEKSSQDLVKKTSRRYDCQIDAVFPSDDEISSYCKGI